MSDLPKPSEIAVDEEASKALELALKLAAVLDEVAAHDFPRLFPRSRLLFCPKDTQLIAQGDEGTDLFLVCRGRVSITKTYGSAGAEVAVLGPGDLFGEISFLQGGSRTASAICLSECRVFRLDSQDMHSLMAQNDKLKRHLEKIVTARLSQ